MGKSFCKGAAVLSCCVFVVTVLAAVARAQSVESGVLDELNFARQTPGAYAQSLLRDAALLRAEAAKDDDAGAFDEAVDFLRKQGPLPPLRGDDALAGAALAHAQTQGQEGSLGHDTDTESFDERLERLGVKAAVVAENISYGFTNPRDVVRQLIVDAGVPDRGHRDIIFNPELRVAGVGCAPHKIYGSMCVVDFADAPTRR